MRFYPQNVIIISGILLLGSLGFSCSPSPEPRDRIELDWHVEEGYQWANLPVDSTGKNGFKLMPSSQTGITFNNLLSDEMIAGNRVLLNGSGVAAGDIDNDGFVDLYFTRLDGPNELYKNSGGFRFLDVTDSAGVAHADNLSTGAVFADVDGDRDLDLLVSSLDKENTLYVNDGSGLFERSGNSGLGPANGSTTMALADIEGDGDLDLYIANYKKQTAKDKFALEELSTQNMVRGDSLISPYDDFYTLLPTEDGGFQPREIGERDELYINDGNGHFIKETDLETRFLDQDGKPVGLDRDFGLTAKFGDLNSDGTPDLYVCNDFWTPDRIWINQGDGTFRAVDTLAVRSASYSSMAVDFSDIDRDGYTDIFTAEMLSTQHKNRLRQMPQSEPLLLSIGEYKNRPRYSRNSLYLNRGDNTYAEISYYSGLAASDWSWGVHFLDVDLDGYEDLLVSTGFAFDLQDIDTQMQISKDISEDRFNFADYILKFPELRQQNKIFQNNGNMTFSDKTSQWIDNADDISQGTALADLDNDGDLEVVVNRMNDEAAIHENLAQNARIAIRLVGASPNTQAVGSKLELHGGPVSVQTKHIQSGGDYVSGSDQLVVFAADPNKENHQLKIQWPDGFQSKIGGLEANRIYRVAESEIQKQSSPHPSVANREQIFRDITSVLVHIHHEDQFNDLQVQPLLPYKLSRLGPGVAWFDINQDGSDELIIGAGKGGRLSVYEHRGTGLFKYLDLGPLTGQSSGDLTGIIAWEEAGRTHLVVGLSNYEIGTHQAPSAIHAQLQNGELVESVRLPGIFSATGPLAAADYSGDGAVDLLIGGRFVPGQYPRDASSFLFLNNQGALNIDQHNSMLLSNIGLVTGALFVDYNLDNKQDLLISTEWGSLRLLENQNGQFNDLTSEVGLDSLHGWWQGLASGDFNNDGYPDLVAANRGQNSSYQVKDPSHPLKIFYGDFNGDGDLALIESYFDPSLGGYVPREHRYRFQSYGELFTDVSSHREFASSTLQELLNWDLNQLASKEINTVQHMVFINRNGQGFEAHPLPVEAQFSTAFDISVADMDNDGNEDLFMSQNMYSVTLPQHTPRQDAGRGLWLRGNGQGEFEVVPGHRSGVTVYGEQRAAAVSDFDNDGRVDLAVTQNGAETRLFRSRLGKRGLRIQLQGPSVNEAGIGSRLRLIYQDGAKGPSRTVQAGSGYWSQNSAVQVMGYKRQPKFIEIVWFDGTQQTVEFVSGKFDYNILYPAG